MSAVQAVVPSLPTAPFVAVRFTAKFVSGPLQFSKIVSSLKAYVVAFEGKSADERVLPLSHFVINEPARLFASVRNAALSVLFLVEVRLAITIPERIAIIAITTISSIRVNPKENFFLIKLK